MTNPTPQKRNAPAATGANHALRKANQMLPERTTEVSQTLDQHRTTINGVDMWELSELQPLITTVSRQSYTDCVLSALEHLGDETAHSYADDVTGDIYLDREVFQLITDALDAPQEVQDYFAPPAVSIRDRLTKHASPATETDDKTQTFDFMGHQLRVITVDDEPWFVLGDACEVLDLNNVARVKNRLDQQDLTTSKVLARDGKRYQTTLVNESGLYDVVLESRKPEAREFRRWITSEVIPSINRHGAYMTPDTIEKTLQDPDFIIGLATKLKDEQTARQLAEQTVQELTPKAELYDELMDADGSYSFGATARILGFGRNVMMRELRRLGVLQGNNLPYRRYDHHFKVTPGTYTNPKTGDVVPTATTTVLPTGLPFLRRKLEGVEV